MYLNQPPQTESAPDKEKKSFLALFKFKKISKVLAIIAILIVIILAVFLGKDIFGRIFGEKNETYSAVFLANGQVYFGLVEKNNDKEIVLSNVFYIQVNDPSTGSGQAKDALGQASFNLVKLGNELHGPTDELFINRSQVVFYEKLRDDSKVVESIKNYK